MSRGTIRRLVQDKQFGFIAPAEGDQDVFFHASRVQGALSFSQLREGLEVEYEAQPGDRGPRATSVRAVATQSTVAQGEVTGTGYRFLNPYNFVRFVTPADAKEERDSTPTALSAALRRAGLMIDGKQDGQNRTVTDVLDKDNTFTFTVDFENLAPVELGALLWALELDECHHRLGFAKPRDYQLRCRAWIVRDRRPRALKRRQNELDAVWQHIGAMLMRMTQRADDFCKSASH